MIKIVSLCMVVYNEEKRVYDTLKKAEPYVDEVVIVDQRSSDRTLHEIERFASQTDVQVGIHFDKHWGYCEPSRRLAHDNSIGDWILVLDADESITTSFATEMRHLDDLVYAPLGIDNFYQGCRLQRSLYIAGTHSWTGDYQYRYFHRKAVRYLDQLHTEPQPTCHNDRIYWRDYVSIIHQKSWAEQARDEEAYLSIIGNDEGIEADRKRDVSSVYTGLLKAAGITAEEADALSQEEREAIGIGLSPINN